MANEALEFIDYTKKPEAVTAAAKYFGLAEDDITPSCVPEHDGFVDGYLIGYDAHESAIRTAAEALMKSIERSEHTLLQLEGSIFAAGFETTLINIRQPAAALKAALAKEKE